MEEAMSRIHSAIHHEKAAVAVTADLLTLAEKGLRVLFDKREPAEKRDFPTIMLYTRASKAVGESPYSFLAKLATAYNVSGGSWMDPKGQTHAFTPGYTLLMALEKAGKVAVFGGNAVTLVFPENLATEMPRRSNPKGDADAMLAKLGLIAAASPAVVIRREATAEIMKNAVPYRTEPLPVDSSPAMLAEPVRVKKTRKPAKANGVPPPAGYSPALSFVDPSLS
jgi:hypothetical protein